AVPDQGWNIAGNEIYKHVDTPMAGIIKKHYSICRGFGLNLPEEYMCLPRIFATVKLHKNPYKQRNIAGARLSSINRLVSFYIVYFVILEHILKTTVTRLNGTLGATLSGL
ncbi:hypothetical protein, partial [Pseudoalteromonas sp.]|uniref:hypothetical protein n=1 Tax=Pseudoalteromonas sp. TaxID=53249 RepID=UPI00260A9712